MLVFCFSFSFLYSVKNHTTAVACAIPGLAVFYSPLQGCETLSQLFYSVATWNHPCGLKGGEVRGYDR